MKYSVLILCMLFLASCVSTTVTELEKRGPPEYVTKISATSTNFRNCFVPKLENYDLLNGLNFGNNTVQVDVRAVQGGEDIYQRTTSILTYIKVRKNTVSLYMYHPNVSANRWTKDISNFIDACKAS